MDAVELSEGTGFSYVNMILARPFEKKIKLHTLAERTQLRMCQRGFAVIADMNQLNMI